MDRLIKYSYRHDLRGLNFVSSLVILWVGSFDKVCPLMDHDTTRLMDTTDHVKYNPSWPL